MLWSVGADSGSVAPGGGRKRPLNWLRGTNNAVATGERGSQREQRSVGSRLKTTLSRGAIGLGEGRSDDERGSDDCGDSETVEKNGTGRR